MGRQEDATDTGVRVRPGTLGSALELRPLEADLENLEWEIAQRGSASMGATLRRLHEVRAGIEALTPRSRELVEALLRTERPGIRQLQEEAGRPFPPSATRGELAVLCERLAAVVGLHARSERTGVVPVGVAVSYRRFEIGELVRRIAGPFQVLAEERALELWVEIGPSMVAELDPRHLSELVLGRLTEALLRTDAGGWVHVEVEPARGRRVEIRITDAGSEERPSHECVHGLTSHDHASLLGGTLTESRAPSGGWTTRVALPLRAPRHVPVGEVTESDREGWRRGAVIARAAASTSVPEGAPPSAAAINARRVKQDFLRMMSHELKTPVTSMRLQLRLLEREAAERLTAEGRERLQRIWVAKKQLLYLIETMLESARYGDRTFRPVVRSFDADAVVAEVIAELDPLTRSPRLRRGRVRPEPRPLLSSDPRIVRLILVNLVMHALRRSDHATVELRVEAHPGAHVFWVHDGGPHMGPREEAEVLAPFEVDLLSRPGVGSGLGLYLVRDLAASIGAAVSVHPPQELRLLVPWLEATPAVAER